MTKYTIQLEINPAEFRKQRLALIRAIKDHPALEGIEEVCDQISSQMAHQGETQHLLRNRPPG